MNTNPKGGCECFCLRVLFPRVNLSPGRSRPSPPGTSCRCCAGTESKLGIHRPPSLPCLHSFMQLGHVGAVARVPRESTARRRLQAAASARGGGAPQLGLRRGCEERPCAWRRGAFAVSMPMRRLLDELSQKHAEASRWCSSSLELTVGAIEARDCHGHD